MFRYKSLWQFAQEMRSKFVDRNGKSTVNSRNRCFNKNQSITNISREQIKLCGKKGNNRLLQKCQHWRISSNASMAVVSRFGGIFWNFENLRDTPTAYHSLHRLSIELPNSFGPRVSKISSHHKTSSMSPGSRWCWVSGCSDSAYYFWEWIRCLWELLITHWILIANWLSTVSISLAFDTSKTSLISSFSVWMNVFISGNVFWIQDEETPDSGSFLISGVPGGVSTTSISSSTSGASISESFTSSIAFV